MQMSLVMSMRLIFRRWLKCRATFITFLISGDDVISLELIFACLYTRNDGNRLRFYHRSSQIIRLTQKIDHAIIIGKSINLLIKNLSRHVCWGENPGKQLEFLFDLRKLFMSVLLSSTLVTFLIEESKSKNVFYDQLLI